MAVSYTNLQPCSINPFNEEVVRYIRKNNLFRDIKTKYSVDIKYERDEYYTSRMVFNIYGDRRVGDAWGEVSDLYRTLVYKHNREQEHRPERSWSCALVWGDRRATRCHIAKQLGMKPEDIPLDMIRGYEMKDKL